MKVTGSNPKWRRNRWRHVDTDIVDTTKIKPLGRLQRVETFRWIAEYGTVVYYCRLQTMNTAELRDIFDNTKIRRYFAILKTWWWTTEIDCYLFWLLESWHYFENCGLFGKTDREGWGWGWGRRDMLRGTFPSMSAISMKQTHAIFFKTNNSVLTHCTSFM